VVFLIKDCYTRSTLLKGRCRDGLSPIPAPHPVKLVFRVNKSSLNRWHERLGHPAHQVVQRVLSSFNLPFWHESNNDSVCGPCRQGKSHQLPYPKSTSVSHHPLDLVFSDV
jgi:hypothetical protein